LYTVPTYDNRIVIQRDDYKLDPATKLIITFRVCFWFYLLMYMNNNPKHIKSIIDDFITSHRWEEQILIESIPSIWESVIGAKISSISTFQRYENGIIYIKVPLAPWRNELILRRQDYIQLINDQLGKAIVTDIIFR
jgi:Dna[CI] antecedent, DciA